MGAVQVEQSDIDAFATTVTQEVTALTTSVTNIGTAVGVVQNYIQTLLANQATPLPAGDESALNAALSSLETEVSAVGTSVGNLDALEPPAPAPPTPGS